VGIGLDLTGVTGLADDMTGATGLADDLTGVATGLMDVFIEEATGFADDLRGVDVGDFGGTGVLVAFTDVDLAASVDLAEDVGLPAADDAVLPEPARARILAAACSAKVTM
jgi:hypothetical protein